MLLKRDYFYSENTIVIDKLLVELIYGNTATLKNSLSHS